MAIDFKKLFLRSSLGALLIHLLTALGIIMFLGVLYFYAYLPHVTNHGETITVPNIEGKTIEELQTFLASHDLRFEVNDSSYSDKYPPLTVLKQFPAAGTKVKENRKIYVSVNRINPPTVPMPNLVDVSVIGAEAILKASELKRGHIHLVSWPFPTVKEMHYKGRKISPNDRIAKGSAIDLVVGDGGVKDVPTPDLIGKTIEDAKVLVYGVNLSFGEIEGDTTDDKVVIIKQKPEPGEIILIGDVVDIWMGQPEDENGD